MITHRVTITEVETSESVGGQTPLLKTEREVFKQEFREGEFDKRELICRINAIPRRKRKPNASAAK